MNEQLKDICENTDGAISAFVCGYDGVLLGEYIKFSSDAHVDIEAMAAELSSVIMKLKNYKMADMMITFIDTCVVVKTFDYGFSGLMMNRDGNLGRAKLELNKMKGVV